MWWDVLDSPQNATLWVREVRLAMLKLGTQGFVVIFYFCVFEHFYSEVIKTNCKAILLLIRPKTNKPPKPRLWRYSIIHKIQTKPENILPMACTFQPACALLKLLALSLAMNILLWGSALQPSPVISSFPSNEVFSDGPGSFSRHSQDPLIQPISHNPHQLLAANPPPPADLYLKPVFQKCPFQSPI